MKNSTVFVLLVLLSLFSRLVAEDETGSPAEPEIQWIFPSGGAPGTTVEAEIQGSRLGSVSSVWCVRAGITARIKSQKDDRVALELKINRQAGFGPRRLRLITRRGISNALEFCVNRGPVHDESEACGDSPENAREVMLPATINGRIGKVAEVDYYAFQAAAGQKMAFEVRAQNFQPVLYLYRAEGSFLNPNKPGRLEPLRDRGRWTHRFERAGRHLVRIGVRYGAADENFIYQLRLSGTDIPALHEDWKNRPKRRKWSEHTFTRELNVDRLAELRSRTVTTDDVARDGPVRSGLTRSHEQEPDNTPPEATRISLPALLEGVIEWPGDADVYRFEVESGAYLVFEIQTTQTAPPRFNPAMEVVDSTGFEVMTNKHRRIALVRQDPVSYLAILQLHLAERDDCGLKTITYFKRLEPKMAVEFKTAGEYFLRIRDITTQQGTPDYRYRVVVRPRIPHVGDIELEEDHVNLVPGEARKLTLVVCHEEGFDGEVAFGVEGLPPGVEPVTGAEVVPRGPAGHASEHEEGLLPLTQKATIMLIAGHDAPPTSVPRLVRVTARPVVEGRLGAPLLLGEIPLVVLRCEK